MSALWFKDESGNLITEYNPWSYIEQGVEHQISANELIIGVYGVKDKRSYFTSFGFIVSIV